MKILFKSGTYLTAENLNCAQLANGSPGVISGAEAYKDDSVITVSSGYVKFSDGCIVYLDGTDSVSWSSLGHTYYYLYLIEYGNDVELEIALTLPTDYTYILLATVKISDSTVYITNVTKSDEADSEMIIDGAALSNNVITGFSTASKSDADRYFNYLILAGSSNKAYFPFTRPGWTPRYLNIRALSDVSISVAVVIDGTTYNISDSVIAPSKLSVEANYKLSLGSILKDIDAGTCCAIAVYTSTTDVSATIRLYSLRISNT